MNDTTQIRRGPGSARDFLSVLFRRRWIIGTVFAVTTLTVLGINFSQPVFYESTGRVIVKRGVRDNIMQGYARTMGWEEELASEVETVKSGAVLGMAQDYLDEQRAVRKRPTTRIAADRVEAQVIGESNVIAMSYQDRNPEEALEVTEAVIHAYMEYRKNEYTLKFPKEFFDSELARVSRELAEWTARREAFMSATGTVNLQQEGAADKDYVRVQELDVVNIEKEIAQRRQTLHDMKAMLAAADPSDVPFVTGTGTGNDPIITEIKQNLSAARVRYREMENIYVPQSRELVQMKGKVDQLEAMLASEVRTRVQLAESEVRALEARAASVRRAQATGEGRLSTYASRIARMSEMETHISALTKNYNELSESAAQAKIAKATSPDWTVDLLTPAGRPYAKNQRDYVRLALAPIFSVIVGLGLAFFVDGLDASLKSPRETEEALELPVLASLTEHKERRA